MKIQNGVPSLKTGVQTLGSIHFKGKNGKGIKLNITREIAQTLGVDLGENGKSISFFKNIKNLGDDCFNHPKLESHQFLEFELGNHKFLAVFDNELEICHLKEFSNEKILVSYGSNEENTGGFFPKFGTELPLWHSCSFKLQSSDSGYESSEIEYVNMSNGNYGAAKDMYTFKGFGKLFSLKLNDSLNLIDITGKTISPEIKMIVKKIFSAIGTDETSLNDLNVELLNGTLNLKVEFGGKKNLLLIDEKSDTVGILSVDSGDELEDLTISGLIAVWKRYAGGKKHLFVNGTEIRGFDNQKYKNVDELKLYSNEYPNQILIGRLKEDVSGYWIPFCSSLNIDTLSGHIKTPGKNKDNINIESFREPTTNSVFGLKGSVSRIDGKKICDSFFTNIDENKILYGSVQSSYSDSGIWTPFYGDKLLTRLKINGEIRKIISCRDFKTVIESDNTKKIYCSIDTVSEAYFKSANDEKNFLNHANPRKNFNKSKITTTEICLTDEIWKINNGYTRI